MSGDIVTTRETLVKIRDVAQHPEVPRTASQRMAWPQCSQRQGGDPVERAVVSFTEVLRVNS